MEDIVADYKDKTVTLEDFAFITPTIKTASVHPCKHASVMKVLLDKADNALKLRLEKLAAHSGTRSSGHKNDGVEGLVSQTQDLDVKGKPSASTSGPADRTGGEEWEDVARCSDDRDTGEQNAIRVDQYLIVFLKFMASVTPGIEHDYTMGV